MGVITDNLDLWGEAIRGTLILFFGGGLLALVVGVVLAVRRAAPACAAAGAALAAWAAQACIDWTFELPGLTLFAIVAAGALLSAPATAAGPAPRR